MRRIMRVMFTEYDGSLKEDRFRSVARETGIAASYQSSRDRRDGYGMLVYYNIIADTDEWKKLETACKKEGLNICLCDDMEIACKLDCTNEYFEFVMGMAKKARQRMERRLADEREILDFVKLEKDPEHLRIILDSFKGYFSDREQEFFRSRIDILEGRHNEIMDEMTSDFESLHCDVRDLMKKSGMDTVEFASYFQIPVRKVREWEEGGYCPKYLYLLIEEKLDREQRGGSDA